MSYTYIATPYSHPDPAVRLYRYRAAMDFTAWALSKRIWCYSPIVHCHDLAIQHKLPLNADFWRDYNQAMLGSARHLIVLQLDGWATSKGVFGEINFARQHDIPISYMTPSAGDYVENYSDRPVDADLDQVKDGTTPDL